MPRVMYDTWHSLQRLELLLGTRWFRSRLVFLFTDKGAASNVRLYHGVCGIKPHFRLDQLKTLGIHNVFAYHIRSRTIFGVQITAAINPDTHGSTAFLTAKVKPDTVGIAATGR